MSENVKVVATNRKASFEYFLHEKFEAGLELQGSEIKSIRAGQLSIQESYVDIVNGEQAWLVEAHIAPYEQANRFNHEPKRPRKLLIHRREMHKLTGAITREGMTLVPLDIHFSPRGIAKVLLGLAKGRRKSDRREPIKDRHWQREKARIFKR